MFNDIFWALYWIDVLSSLGKGILTGGFLALLFGGFIGFMRVLIASTIAHDDDGVALKKGWTWGRTTFVAVWVAFTAGCFIPDKQTMYIMLGVRTTDNVMQSDFGKKVQKIVDSQLDGLVKKYAPKE